MTISKDILAGLLLACAALAGLAFENIGLLRPLYDALLTTKLTVAVSDAAISKPLLLWINDGLMAVFFLLVALEIKREARHGALSKWSNAALPVYGAVGGIIAPALIFLGIVGIDSAEAKGWAIPAATDIAFALGVLSLFGNRVPALLKTFLLTLAVVDDLAAIVIIALFYTADLSLPALGIAGISLIALIAMNLRGLRSPTAFILVGIVLWVAVLKSGVHATLAGVALGFAIPLATDDKGRSPAIEMEHNLHPWVSFLVLPLFAFANAGVPLAGISANDLAQPLPLAIAAGLVLGKPIGVFGAASLAIALGLAARPKALTWARLFALSCLAGIGFTMSLFIGSLAFAAPELQNMVRIGVLCGSILSGVIGALVLRGALRPADA